MFRGAKLSDEVVTLLAEPPYESKSIATVRVDDMAVHLLTWNPIDDADRSQGFNDRTGTTAYAGAWALDDPDFLALLPRSPNVVDLVEPWRPMTYDDVRDVVEANFGLLGIDPEPRSLGPTLEPDHDCPACRGEQFRLVLELAFSAQSMCDQHRKVARQRLDDAEQDILDNEEAWSRWEDAAGRFGAVHVSRPVRENLDRLWREGAPYDLLAEGRTLRDLLRVVQSEEDLADVVDDLGFSDDEFDDWTTTLTYRVGAAHEFELAAALIQGLDRGLPETVANRHSQLAVDLAEAGRHEDARREIEIALGSAGRDPLTEMQAGQVHQALGDASEARRWFEMSIETARADPVVGLDYELEAWRFLEDLAIDNDWDELETQARDEHERIVEELRRRRAQNEQPVTRDDVQQWGHKVGRNDPCPCGSGRKYKQCHARH